MNVFSSKSSHIKISLPLIFIFIEIFKIFGPAHAMPHFFLLNHSSAKEALAINESRDNEE